MNNKKILLTGNLGYIGPVMTKLLKNEGFYVVGLDTGFFSDNTFFNLESVYQPDIQIIKDVRDVSLDDVKDIYGVIHLAGLSNDPLGDLNPTLTDDINLKATLKLAKLCKTVGVERFVFASSCSVYGICENDNPIDENGVLNPITAYAKSKIDSEKGLKELADYNFSPVFLRNATVYGLSPRLRLDLVVNNLLSYAYITGEMSILSDGTPWRPLVHVEDFCRAHISTLSAPTEKVHCEVFNSGIIGGNYQVKGVAELIKTIMPECNIKILNETGSDERTYKVDFLKVNNLLPGFKPKWTLEEGIKDLLSAYKTYNLTLDDFESHKFFRIRTIKKLLKEGKITQQLIMKKNT